VQNVSRETAGENNFGFSNFRFWIRLEKVCWKYIKFFNAQKQATLHMLWSAGGKGQRHLIYCGYVGCSISRTNLVINYKQGSGKEIKNDNCAAEVPNSMTDIGAGTDREKGDFPNLRLKRKWRK
jgi:hypothetical protein